MSIIYYSNPQFGRPLLPDSSVTIELTGVDFSTYDSTYLLTASLEMKRDINDTNNSLTKTIIPKLSIGNIAALPNEICFGTSVELSAANIIGAGNWQFSDDGMAFQNYQPNDTLVQQVFQPTFYRYQVCNFLYRSTIHRHQKTAVLTVVITIGCLLLLLNYQNKTFYGFTPLTPSTLFILVTL